jgi:CBS domain-containing protein/sporulation protein YlmC with PRC-barrel domain
MGVEKGFAFRYVSEILGRRVTDLGGGSIGRVQDVVASMAQPYPLVRGLMVGRRPGAVRFAPCPCDQLARLRHRQAVRIDPATLQDPTLAPHDFLVRDWLLDKQIVDVQGAKVERVNDVHILFTDRAWIVHVDVGGTGLLRRLGFIDAARRLTGIVRQPLKDELISWKFVQTLAETEELGRPIRLKIEHSRIRDLHPGELADILEDLGKEERALLVHSLGPEAVADVLEEAEGQVQTSVISQLEPSVAADILEEMDPGEAADILGNLRGAHTDEIIAEVEAPERAQLEQLIEYEEKTAASLMTPEFISVPPETTVAAALAEVRRLASEIEAIYYTYVLDPQGHLKGVTTLRSMLRAQPEQRLGEIMETRLVTVHPEQELKEIAEVFQKYSFLGCPVVDDEMRMMGVVLIKHAFDDLLPEFKREARA